MFTEMSNLTVVKLKSCKLLKSVILSKELKKKLHERHFFKKNKQTAAFLTPDPLPPPPWLLVVLQFHRLATMSNRLSSVMIILKIVQFNVFLFFFLLWKIEI